MFIRSLTSLALFAALLADVAQAAPCNGEKPVLFILQDKSGTMGMASDGSPATAANSSKWSIAQQLVPQLASQFAGRLRFGVGMYPGDSALWSCSTGTTISEVGATPDSISIAYGQAVTGGGTPTGASLEAARTHLLSLGLQGPVAVLLLTDGLPNCNLSLNASTCQMTTPGCIKDGIDICNFGPKDCLDDAVSEQVAARLLADKIKVYVVGFDTKLTGGNNKAVLDRIAAAGGTGTAFAASDQAQLAQALNQIAQSSTACCTNACTAGELRCSGTVVETCGVGAGGCTEWQKGDDCGYGELCNSGSCGTCQACALGASRCSGAGVQTCEWNVPSGCTTWKTASCPSGSTCRGSACAVCNTACTAGTSRCNGSTIETCLADAQGCTSWQGSQTCTTYCSGGACGSCGTQCAEGSKRCNGNGVETCTTDKNGCTVWGMASMCAAGSYCAQGACVTCGNSCTQGARRCSGTGATEECRLDAHGCLGWVQNSTCDVAAQERCVEGVCMPTCESTCTVGAVECANGRPRSCQKGPTGCAIWRDEGACGASASCLEGHCRKACASDELGTCAAGEVCTQTPQGRFCMPSTPQPTPPAGSSASPAGTTEPSDAAAVRSKSVSAGPSGCSAAGSDFGAGLLALVLAARARGRRTTVVLV